MPGGTQAQGEGTQDAGSPEDQATACHPRTPCGRSVDPTFERQQTNPQNEVGDRGQESFFLRLSLRCVCVSLILSFVFPV